MLWLRRGMTSIVSSLRAATVTATVNPPQTILSPNTSAALQIVRTKKGSRNIRRLIYRPNAEKRLKMIGMQRFTTSFEGKVLFWKQLIRSERIVDGGPYVDMSKVKVKDKYDRFHKTFARYDYRTKPHVRT